MTAHVPVIPHIPTSSQDAFDTAIRTITAESAVAMLKFYREHKRIWWPLEVNS